MRTLMVGVSEAFLRGVEGRVAPNCITAIEEPDLVRERRLADLPSRLSCLAEILPAAYLQADEALDVAAAASECRPFQAVLPGVEYAVPAAAGIAAKLGLAGATEFAAATLRDKARLREVTEAAGIRNPRWRWIDGPEDIVAFGGGGPVVVKPSDRQASVGVQLLDASGPAEAAAAWQCLLDAREPAEVDRPLAARYMVEQRMRGPEYSVEALVDSGRIVFVNITEKAVLPGPHPVELGHLVPAPLPAAPAAALTHGMSTLVAAVGFDTGILHAEWIRTADRPALVECAGRCPGDRIVDLIDLAYRTDLRVALLHLLAGRHPRPQAQPVCTSTIRFLTAPPGIVAELRGRDAAARLAGVQEVSVSASVGSQVQILRSSWDRPGYVIVTGGDPVETTARANAAAARVRIQTK